MSSRLILVFLTVLLVSSHCMFLNCSIFILLFLFRIYFFEFSLTSFSLSLSLFPQGLTSFVPILLHFSCHIPFYIFMIFRFTLFYFDVLFLCFHSFFIFLVYPHYSSSFHFYSYLQSV